MGTFWATFSQTHLVNLIVTQIFTFCVSDPLCLSSALADIFSNYFIVSTTFLTDRHLLPLCNGLRLLSHMAVSRREQTIGLSLLIKLYAFQIFT
jgi:hypothetical protein